MKRLLVSWLIAVSGMTLSSANAADIVIGTGGENGVYHATGKAICDLIGKSGGPSCEARSSGGSVRNLKDIADGKVNFAMAQSDWQFHAFKGSTKWEGKPVANLRAVMSIYPEAVQVIANDKVKRWHDLKGKRVNIGNPGSGQRETMEEMMTAQGWRASSFDPASEVNSTQQIELFCAGKLDAFVHVVGIPNAAMAKAVSECGGKIVEPSSTIVRKLATSARPYYSKVTLPADTYKKGQTKVDTFGVLATLVTGAETDGKLVDAVVKAVFAAFKAKHPSYANADPANMVMDGLSAPLHPAAKAYYDSKGWKTGG